MNQNNILVRNKLNSLLSYISGVGTSDLNPTSLEFNPIELIGTSDEKKLLPFLRMCMINNYPIVRKTAIDIAYNLDKLDHLTLFYVQNLILDERDDIRWMALDTLNNKTNLSLLINPVIQNDLSSEIDAVDFPENVSGTIGLLCRLMAITDLKIRKNAALAIGWYYDNSDFDLLLGDDSYAYSILIKLMGDSENIVASAAIAVLYLNYRESISMARNWPYDLIELFNSDNCKQKSRAIEWVGILCKEEDSEDFFDEFLIDSIIDLLNDDSIDVRESVVLALGDMTTHMHFYHLQKIINLILIKNYQIRKSALDALIAIFTGWETTEINLPVQMIGQDQLNTQIIKALSLFIDNNVIMPNLLTLVYNKISYLLVECNEIYDQEYLEEIILLVSGYAKKGIINKELVYPLTKLLDCRVGDICEYSLDALKEMAINGILDDSSLPTLINLLNSNNLSVRKSAVVTIGLIIENDWNMIMPRMIKNPNN